MKYAYVNEGVLQDVVMTHPSILFAAGYANRFIEVPDECQSGWLYDGQNFSPPPAETAEQRASFMRFMRNEKLAECDWTQVADAPVDKAAWATYRQALRDISAQPGWPWSVEWPAAPT